ncbi:MAG: tetratricopeptide repeat protein, partial [Candidatus Brocadiales bacterium]
MQFTPKPEKPKRRVGRKLLIIAISIGVVLILLMAFLLPQLLFEKKPKKRDAPPAMVLTKRARPAPEKQAEKKPRERESPPISPRETRLAPEKKAEKPPLEVLIEEIIISEPVIQEIVEVAPEPVKEAPKVAVTEVAPPKPEAVKPAEPLKEVPKVAVSEAIPPKPEAVKPAEPFIEVLELVPAISPPTPGVAVSKRPEEEKPRIEIKAMPPAPRPEEPPVEKAPTVARPVEPTVEAKPILEKEIPVPPLPGGEAVTPVVPEVARGAVTPPVAEPAEGLAPTVPPEEEVTAGLRKMQRAEKFKLALFYQKSGETNKAEAQYQELLRDDPMDAEAHNNLGSVYQGLGHYEKAEAEFRKAVLL